MAITLTDALRDAINARAAADSTTAGLLCRKIVADFLNVTIDIVRAPNGAAKTPEQKIANRDDDAVLRARLLAQNAYEQNNPTWADDADMRAARIAAGEAAAIAKRAALVAKRAKDAAAASAAPTTDAAPIA